MEAADGNRRVPAAPAAQTLADKPPVAPEPPVAFEPQAAARYQANLTALSSFQADVAAVVEGTPIPQGVVPARGRDGSDTFLITTDTGRRVWFGGSSMPTISVPEMLAGFRHDGGGTFLPGILTGHEALVLADTMPAHCAVFVIEEEPLNVKLAMCLHDYTGLIHAGRLVVFLEGNLDEGLRSFFQAHPGYALPRRMVNVPHRSPAQIAERRGRLEIAGEGAADVLARSVDSCVQALAGRSFGPLPDRPRIAIVGADAHPVSLEQGRRLARAITAFDWPCDLCVPDAPANCHIVARLRAIERVRADLVLVVNAVAGPLQSLLPSGLPLVSWYLPGASVSATADQPSSAGQVVFASSKAIQNELLAMGLDPQSIELCEPGADDTTYRPITLTPEELQAEGADVVVLMDLPDDRPEASDVVLESHTALWGAAREAVRQNADRYRDDIADDLLEKAQRKSGTTLHEESIRQQFVAMLRVRIAPTCVARAAVDALVADGHRVGAWGTRWSQVYPNSTIGRGAIPLGEDLNRLFNATSIVVLPDPSDWAIQTSLDALAAGAYALCRSSADWLCREYPGLAELAPYLHFYESRADLIAIVRSIRSVAGTPAGRAEAGRSIVLDGHTMARRLRAMVDRLRRGME